MAGPGDIPGAPQDGEEDSGAKQSLNDLTQCHGQRVGPSSADFSPALVLPFLDSLVEERGQTTQRHIHWRGSELPEKGHKNGWGGVGHFMQCSLDTVNSQITQE